MATSVGGNMQEDSKTNNPAKGKRVSPFNSGNARKGNALRPVHPFVNNG